MPPCILDIVTLYDHYMHVIYCMVFHLLLNIIVELAVPLLHNLAAVSVSRYSVHLQHLQLLAVDVVVITSLVTRFCSLLCSGLLDELQVGSAHLFYYTSRYPERLEHLYHAKLHSYYLTY